LEVKWSWKYCGTLGNSGNRRLENASGDQKNVQVENGRLVVLSNSSTVQVARYPNIQWSKSPDLCLQIKDVFLDFQLSTLPISSIPEIALPKNWRNPRFIKPQFGQITREPNFQDSSGP
jgi:hypothetical protein